MKGALWVEMMVKENNHTHSIYNTLDRRYITNKNVGGYIQETPRTSETRFETQTTPSHS
jgi:hypothetical protein